MILPIYIYGMPVLRKEAQDITPDYPELKKLIADMWETLDNSEGIGLAAPQIGKDIRLVLVNLDPLSEDLPEFKDFRRVYINGRIVEYDDSVKESSEEGCLSVPGVHEPVVRPKRIRIQYLDEDFQPHDEYIDSYLARVLQHEHDHLDGKLFVDRLSALRKQLVKGKLKNILSGRFRCGYKFKARIR